MKRTIIQLGDPVLRKEARLLTQEEIKSAQISELISDMKETMRRAPGVGLAAPQIGVSLQVAVVEDKPEYFSVLSDEVLKERDRSPVKFHVIINPKIKLKSSSQCLFFEGCLSIPHFARITPRAAEIEVEYLDENGIQKQAKASGWYARILQHEIDHLNGKLYIDIADERTKIDNSKPEAKQWANASRNQIEKYYHQCLKS